MNKTKTNRGFQLIEFEDSYDNKCSLQKSSLATYDCIWLGIDDVNPLVMANDAKKLGIKTNETTGWVDYPIPESVLMTSRMHLTVDQVKALLPYLNKFVETGEL